MHASIVENSRPVDFGEVRLMERGSDHSTVVKAEEGSSFYKNISFQFNKHKTLFTRNTPNLCCWKPELIFLNILYSFYKFSLGGESPYRHANYLM